MNAPATPLKTAAGEAFSLTPFALSHGDTLKHLAQNPGATHLEIAAATGRDSSNTRRDLAKLVSAGVVDTGNVLTEAGKLAVEAMARLEIAEGAQRGDQLKILHHHIAANPLNPRRAFEDIEALADTIEAAGDVLQNLVVFPPDAEGVHVLADGERRWRAVGLLIDQGRWPRDRPLPCRQREHDESQTDFLALVANGQRQNLSILEEARAYLRLTEAQGWSAREAALKTGRDVRTVQEMLKVLREAPAEAIGWCEQGRFTWEELRGLVRTPKAPEPPPAAEPEQRDIEEIAGPGSLDEQYRARIFAGCQALSARALMVLVETVDKIMGEPSGPLACYVGEDRSAYAREVTDLIHSVGFGIAFAPRRPPQATVSEDAIDWLREKALLTSEGPRDRILSSVRMAAVKEIITWAAERKGAYVVPWLNPAEPAASPKPAERPGLTGDAFSRQLHEAVDDGASPPPLGEGDREAAEGVDAEEADKAAAAETLAKVRAGLASGCFGPAGQIAFRDLLEAAGMVGPIITGAGDNPGQLATRDQYLGAIDTEGALPDALAIARAELIAFAVNAFAGYSVDAHRAEQGRP